MDRIKRLSYEVLEKYKAQFGEDFAENKKTLDQLSIIRSKGLKNKIAGYITKFIKKEVHDEKIKQARAESAQPEESIETEVQVETEPTLETETVTESTTETVTEPAPEPVPETVEEKTE